MKDDSYSLARAAKRFAVVAAIVVLARTTLTENSPRDSIGLAAILGTGAAAVDYAVWRRSRDEPATPVDVHETSGTRDDEPAEESTEETTVDTAEELTDEATDEPTVSTDEQAVDD